jgi:hypothetical protein
MLRTKPAGRDATVSSSPVAAFAARWWKVSFGSNLAVPLAPGGGPLSDVKLKKQDQELTLGLEVGLPLESSHTPRRPRTAGCSQDRSCVPQRGAGYAAPINHTRYVISYGPVIATHYRRWLRHQRLGLRHRHLTWPSLAVIPAPAVATSPISRIADPGRSGPHSSL